MEAYKREFTQQNQKCEFEFTDGSILRVTDEIEIIVKDNTVFNGSLLELVEQFIDLDDLE